MKLIKEFQAPSGKKLLGEQIQVVDNDFEGEEIFIFTTIKDRQTNSQTITVINVIS